MPSNLLLADSKNIDLKNIRSTVSKIECSYEDALWHDVDMNSMEIQLPYSEEEEAVLLINLYRGSPALIDYPAGEEMEATLNPYATVMLTDELVRDSLLIISINLRKVLFISIIYHNCNFIYNI